MGARFFSFFIETKTYRGKLVSQSPLCPQLCCLNLFFGSLQLSNPFKRDYATCEGDALNQGGILGGK